MSTITLQVSFSPAVPGGGFTINATSKTDALAQIATKLDAIEAAQVPVNAAIAGAKAAFAS